MIRKAVREDVPQIVILAAQMHAESKFKKYSFDPWKTHVQIEALLTDGIVLVAEELTLLPGGHDEYSSRIIGGFVGFIQPHFFGHDLAAYDVGLFLDQEHRGSTVALRLIKAYIAEAKARGVAEVCIANSTGFQKERVARLFEHAGFSHDGYVFSMNVQEG